MGWFDSTGLLSNRQAYWHYFTGNGSISVDFSEVGGGVGLGAFSSYSGAKSAYIAKATPSGASPEPFSQRQSIDIGGAIFGRVWFNLEGDFTSTCDRWQFEGKISAEDDIFDFQHAPWGERDYWKEVATRYLGAIVFGQSFTIHINGSKKVSESGSL